MNWSLLFFFNKTFEKCISWIALALLMSIGGNMLIDGLKHEEQENTQVKLGIGTLLLQGIATSIDALSVGFAIVEYDFLMAFVCALIIAIVTFIICMIGLIIGRKFGTIFSDKANILGGVILILIGIEIFITGKFK